MRLLTLCDFRAPPTARTTVSVLFASPSTPSTSTPLPTFRGLRASVPRPLANSAHFSAFDGVSIACLSSFRGGWPGRFRATTQYLFAYRPRGASATHSGAQPAGAERRARRLWLVYQQHRCGRGNGRTRAEASVITTAVADLRAAAITAAARAEAAIGSSTHTR
jgi:hypothetical protein